MPPGLRRTVTAVTIDINPTLDVKWSGPNRHFIVKASPKVEIDAGITVEAFLKRTAVARANEAALRRMANSIVALADHEGFPAHGNAIRRRFG